MNQPTPQHAYLAFSGYERHLRDELSGITAIHDRLMLASADQRPLWAQNIWYNPTFLTIDSISHAVRKLRAIQRNWWPYAFTCHRRMALIHEQLPHIADKPLLFLQPPINTPLGSFTLLDNNTLLFASQCLSPRANGQWSFNEDKLNPPSRAYLKLWELFTRLGIYPGKNDICLDLGACPGGWSFVLASLCKQVIAVDRSELAEHVMAFPNVTFIKGDAFKIDLAHYSQASWVLSDVICYPEKLYEFIAQLLASFPDKKYVFTIKFQGYGYKDIMARFKKLPGELLHLSNNKHEIMWFKI